MPGLVLAHRGATPAVLGEEAAFELFRGTAASHKEAQLEKSRARQVLRQVGMTVLGGLVGGLVPAIPWWGRILAGVGSGLVESDDATAAGLGIAAGAPTTIGISRAITRQVASRVRGEREEERPSLVGDIALPYIFHYGYKHRDSLVPLGRHLLFGKGNDAQFTEVFIDMHGGMEMDTIW